MRSSLILALCIVLILASGACKKDKKEPSPDDCFSGSTIIRQITDAAATVYVTATTHGIYLVEKGAIDTRLIPCNLPKEFLQNNLAVMVSGEVRSGVAVAGGPCCSQNFVITKIRRV